MDSNAWWREHINVKVDDHTKVLAEQSVQLTTLDEKLDKVAECNSKQAKTLNDINRALWAFKWLARVLTFIVAVFLALTGKISFTDILNFSRGFMG